MNSKFFESLKVGSVACIPGYGLSSKEYTRVTVKRITPSGRLVVEDKNGNEITFDKHGRRMGASKWDHSWLAELTPEMIEERNDQRRRRIIRDYDFNHLASDDIKKVYELLVTLPTCKEKQV